MSSRCASLHPKWRMADSSSTAARAFLPISLHRECRCSRFLPLRSRTNSVRPRPANIIIIMMGALLGETECMAPKTALIVLEDKVKKLDLLEIDRNALTARRLFMDDQAHVGAVSQPDGFA
jgi:hypothetical protein